MLVAPVFGSGIMTELHPLARAGLASPAVSKAALLTLPGFSMVHTASQLGPTEPHRGAGHLPVLPRCPKERPQSVTRPSG